MAALLNTKLATGLSLGLVLAFGLTSAQAEPPERGEGPPPERIEKMKKKRGQMLRTHVGLSDAKAARVELIIDQYQPRKRELRKELRALKQELRALLESDSNDEAAYARVLDGMHKRHTELHTLRLEEREAVRGELTAKQQAKLLQAMHHHKKMRKHHRKGRRGGDGPDPFRDED